MCTTRYHGHGASMLPLQPLQPLSELQTHLPRQQQLQHLLQMATTFPLQLYHQMCQLLCAPPSLKLPRLSSTFSQVLNDLVDSQKRLLHYMAVRIVSTRKER